MAASSGGSTLFLQTFSPEGVGGQQRESDESTAGVGLELQGMGFGVAEGGEGEAGANATYTRCLNKEKVAVTKSGIVGATFNFVNSIVGAGIIGLPFALRHCGLWMGLILLVLVAVATDYSVRLLVNCGIKLSCLNYEELAEKVLGTKGFYVLCVSMFLTAYGAMCAYIIIIGDTIPRIAVHSIPESFLTDRETVIFIFAFFVILPLSVLRDMASLSWSSSISVAADVAIVFIMVFHAPTVARRQGIELDFAEIEFARPTLFAGVGAMSFAFVCHHSSFLVFTSLHNATSARWGRVTRLSVSIAAVACFILGTAGYLSFLDETEGDVLNNFPDTDVIAGVGRALLAVTMFFTFPMEHYVARHVLHCCVARRRGDADRPMTDRERYAYTALLWSSTLIIGMSTTNLGVVLEITGAVAGSMLAYILPGTLYICVHRHEFAQALAAWRKSSPAFRPQLAQRFAALMPFFLPVALGIMGVIAMVAGVVTILVAG